MSDKPKEAPRLDLVPFNVMNCAGCKHGYDIFFEPDKFTFEETLELLGWKQGHCAGCQAKAQKTK